MLTQTIIPVTKARGKLGDLAEGVSGEDCVILTKSGSPMAALVDYKYLMDLRSQINKLYRKTFIDPSLKKYTRDFTNKEIGKWVKEDEL